MTGAGLNPFGPEDFGRVLARRLKDITAAAARYEAFAYEEGDGGRPLDGQSPSGGETGNTLLARDVALGALRSAGDPIAYAMLRRMAAGDAPLADLMAETGLPRLAVWERVNTLVAAGLAGRDHATDIAGLTPAGRSIVDFIEAAVATATAAASPDIV